MTVPITYRFILFRAAPAVALARPELAGEEPSRAVSAEGGHPRAVGATFLDVDAVDTAQRRIAVEVRLDSHGL